jgi:hypothetical protein
MEGNLKLQLPTMIRLNQTDPAKFSILACWAFVRDSVFLYFIKLQYYIQINVYRRHIFVHRLTNLHMF